MRVSEVLDMFKQTGALLEGHFILSSGLHSEKYLQSALVLQYASDAERFGRALAESFRFQSVETVASPAIGGLVIGYEVARALNARFIWTEREAGRMTLRRGFSIREGESVLVIEDVITTGGSTRETIDVLRSRGRPRHRGRRADRPLFRHRRRGRPSCFTGHLKRAHSLALHVPGSAFAASPPLNQEAEVSSSSSRAVKNLHLPEQTTCSLP
ncbi:MAG: orotate phosphoribosyltransferase [Pyrinomonadaceae bacterium]